MISEDKVARINALARKSKSEGLSEAEKAEQATLRREYIDAVKESLRPQVEAIRYVEPDGTIVNPQTGRPEGHIEEEAEDDEDPRKGLFGF